MTPPSRKEDALMDAEVREKIHLEILKRTGAYHANECFVNGICRKLFHRARARD